MPESSTSNPDMERLVIQTQAGTCHVEFQGDWKKTGPLPDFSNIDHALASMETSSTVHFTASVSAWDSRLAAFLHKSIELCDRRGLKWETKNLPEGLDKLIRLALAVPEKEGAKKERKKDKMLERLGIGAMSTCKTSVQMLTFLGECAMVIPHLIRGKARIPWSDAVLVMQQTGMEALPIVAALNFMVGMILGFIGSTELQRFGAATYVASLVGIAAVREMGSIMTGIIMSGRTGAAFAAQLGTMKVNEEIDALRTLGISPIEYLVLPRMVALFLMMPFLCVFADLMIILGGATVALSLLDVTGMEYYNRTVSFIQLPTYLFGIIKGSCFGVLVAITGCLRGMQCGNNAAAVGEATTSAVVLGISSIILADAFFAVIFKLLGF